MVWVHNASQAINDKSQWPTIFALCLSLTIFMVLIVSARGYVRGFMLKSIGIDDWIIFFSMVCSIIYSGLAVGQTKWGLGLDLPDRPEVNINRYAVINFAGRPFYMAGITGFKVALCISYIRILRQTNTLYKKIVWAIMISCVTLHLAGTLVLIFQCTPMRKSWKPLTPGHCLPNAQTFYALAAVTIFYDCIIFLLPIPILMKLQINNRRKAVLLGVFGLGIFTTVCSILRMVQIIAISRTGNSTKLVLWGTIEMNVGIVLTCIPTLAPLFTYFRERSTGGYDVSGSRRLGNSHSLAILKTPKSRIPEGNSEGWKDRNSSDNNSQEAIIGLKNSLAGLHQTSAGEKQAGILATTTIEVRVSNGGN
ncbi:hypothetical protein D0Z07_8940 [Hyphodiscus hymeniophilus]|uniref:Rhodopsin domain-containing protein n=1 Tax=Hyphodiscus hymeniophilus TaxID=353542 RepID=A0A9P6SJW3_9HELO|nr:hypothetical protein D0Z07_8940 [Hyphodiscus hymeniophilus]